MDGSGWRHRNSLYNINAKIKRRCFIAEHKSDTGNWQIVETPTVDANKSIFYKGTELESNIELVLKSLRGYCLLDWSSATSFCQYRSRAMCPVICELLDSLLKNKSLQFVSREKKKKR